MSDSVLIFNLRGSAALRLRFLVIGLRAIMLACVVFAVTRGMVEWQSGLLTPWWINVLGFVFAYLLHGWLMRDPNSRIDVTVHIAATLASIIIWVPLLYGMESTIWWLTMVGFSTSLMANKREAMIWAILIVALIAMSSAFGAEWRIANSAGETLTEQVLARGAFAVLLFFIAYSFARETDRAADEIAQASENLRRANHAKTRFLAHMSHELRTPLHGVIAMTEHALNDELSAKQHGRIAAAHGSAKVLLRLLNDVLDISRAESDALMLESRPFQLHHAVAEVVQSVAAEISDSGLRFEATAERGLIEARVGDEVRLKQIVLNLLHNAIKFTHKGSIALSISAWTERTDGVIIEVRDTGIGIAEQDLQRLSQPFVQIDASSTRNHGGAGLGLSIVRELAERMHGDLKIDSHIGSGSVFRVRLVLPIQSGATVGGQQDLLRELAVAHLTDHIEKSNKPLKILVCEDNAINQLVIGESLSVLGHVYTVVLDGDAGMQAIKEHRFDAVLTDIEMPVMDGFAFLQALRAHEQAHGSIRTPVFAVTAHAKPDDRQRFEAAGFDGYLPKPFQLAHIHRLLNGLYTGPQ